MHFSDVIIPATTHIVAEDLVNDLARNVSHENLLEFIKSLDEAVADWSFTEALHKYTSAEMEKKAEEDEWVEPSIEKVTTPKRYIYLAMKTGSHVLGSYGTLDSAKTILEGWAESNKVDFFWDLDWAGDNLWMRSRQHGAIVNGPYYICRSEVK